MEPRNWDSAPQGYMEPDELDWLCSTAESLPPGAVWVEIGTWRGRSMYGTVRGLPYGSQLIGVDHFRGNVMEPGAKTTQILSEVGRSAIISDCNDTVAVLRSSHPMVEITILCMPSLEAANILRSTGTLADVVFLDGGHTEHEVRSDLEAWTNLLVPGGIMIGHDINQLGVRAAVEWAFGPNGFERPVGSLWRSNPIRR